MSSVSEAAAAAAECVFSGATNSQLYGCKGKPAYNKVSAWAWTGLHQSDRYAHDWERTRMLP